MNIFLFNPRTNLTATRINGCPTINVPVMLGSMVDIQTSVSFPAKTFENFGGCTKA
jgi:hypothetical protein